LENDAAVHRESIMTAHDAASQLPAPPTRVRFLLGIVLILAGILVLGDIAIAALISTMFIAIVAIVAGAFEIAHAFWAKGWGGFFWQFLLGVLYVAFGIVLLSEPASGALLLTYLIGLLLLISGLVRTLFSFSHWRQAGWVMLLSGVFGVLAGLVVLTGFPKATLWVLGLVLGIDLLFHGVAWLTYVWLPAARST
jgi:uncharacterized membrane protein HdeD (DUF308 family)